MIDQPENVQHFQSNLNQSANQANDPELYPTMKKVIQQSKEKVLFDQKKEDEVEKIEGEEKESMIKPGSLSIKKKADYKRVNEEFKNIFNKENSNINDLRRNLIHIIMVASVVNCIAWEFDCLFLNACYGENIEMVRWISALLFPFIIISILFLYLLYVTINYLRQTPIKICSVIYGIISVLFVALGVTTLVIGGKYNEDKASSDIKKLTKNEFEYYGENEIDASKNLKYYFQYKMIFTGVLDLVIGFFGIIVVCLSVAFNSLLTQTTFDWRPPLRSHVRMSRILKAIELVAQNTENYIRVFRAENPNYQLDEFENKDENRFGRVRNMIGDSLDISKDKKSISNKENNIDNNNINNINNNDDEDEFLPKAQPRRKRVNISDKFSEKNKKSAHDTINNKNKNGIKIEENKEEDKKEEEKKEEVKKEEEKKDEEDNKEEL